MNCIAIVLQVPLTVKDERRHCCLLSTSPHLKERKFTKILLPITKTSFKILAMLFIKVVGLEN
jgi:hypothetical protein